MARSGYRSAQDTQRTALVTLQVLIEQNEEAHPGIKCSGAGKSAHLPYRAWKLKDEFEAFWNYNAPWAGVRFLDAWMTRIMRSRLEPLKKIVPTTVRKHYDGIVTFIETGLRNAVSEGLNRVVKIVKKRASGFRTLDVFTDMIFLSGFHPSSAQSDNIERTAISSAKPLSVCCEFRI